jgi:hypothetical protein
LFFNIVGYAMLRQTSPTSTSVAAAARNLAAAYKSLGRTADARRTLESALQQVSRAHGAQNALTNGLQGELAALLQASNHYQRALSAYYEVAASPRPVQVRAALQALN